MGSEQIVSFLFFVFNDFWWENDVMNTPKVFEFQKYTNLIIAFERTCIMRDITGIIHRLSLFYPKMLIFES